MDEIKPYTRSLDDELDWKLLDQLHDAVSQISGFCFETKKFCVTTEFVVLTLFAKFTHDRLDHSLFVVGIVLPLAFWILDSVGYYYQVKLRGMMNGIRAQITSRSHVGLVLVGRRDFIAPDRVSDRWFVGVARATFNHSMWLYAMLVAADALAWFLFQVGGIT